MSLRPDCSIDDSHDLSTSSCGSSTKFSKGSRFSVGLSSKEASSSQPISSGYYYDLIGNSACTGHCPPAIIVYPLRKKRKKGQEYISENFIQEFNERIGDESNVKKAKRLMRKMQVMAGLHPSSTPENVDLPAARYGLALLSGLNHHDLKLEALNHLEYLLEHDPITEQSSVRLVALTIKMMNQMAREHIQAEILEVQIKRAKIYSLLAELIQRHYVKNHINAITDDLRKQLSDTAKALQSLNRLEDPRLNFYVESALQGINRILDDHNHLYEIVNRLYSAVMAGVSVYVRDLSNFPQFVDTATRGIDFKFKFGWYDAALTLLKLGREAINDREKLSAIQKFIHDKASELDWKFLFLAVDILTNIAINSPDPEIRKQAFIGDRSHHDLPGLLNYSNCSILGKGVNARPVIHLRRPKLVNHDATIRLYIAKSLIRIGNESPDLLIRMRARMEFLKRYKEETSRKALNYMDGIYTSIGEKEFEWVNEMPPFERTIADPSPLETASITPRRNVDFSSFFHDNVYNGADEFAHSEAVSENSSTVSQYDGSETPSHPTLHQLVELSDKLIEEKRYEETAAILTKAIHAERQSNKDDIVLSNLYLKRGVAQTYSGNIPAAQHDFSKAYELDPTNSIALKLLKDIQP